MRPAAPTPAPLLRPAIGTLIAALSIAISAFSSSGKAEKNPQPRTPASASARPTAAQAPAAPAAQPRPPSGQPYRGDPRIAAFAADLAHRRDLPEPQVRAWLEQAHKLPSVQRLILPPPHPLAKNWQAYRARFIEPQRLQAGRAFWQRNARWLARAEAQTGVPAWLIVGVLGVETLYGRHMGSYRTLDALATLAFDFPAAHPRAAARQAYFRDELEQYLSLCQRHGLDPTQLRSSYAGAMGLPQFMPSSWARYAIDFDGDGRVDLFASEADAIGSVARYFQAFGYKPGLPTHYAAEIRSTPAELDELLAPDILPTWSPQRLAERGVRALAHPGAAEPLPPEQLPSPLALIQLFNGDPAHGGAEPHYALGTENFYAITRYNWSSYYALAVIELGQAVADAVHGRSPSASLAGPALPRSNGARAEP